MCRGLSLNKCISPGENLYPDLSSILLRFRCHAIGFTADVRKAFLQILLEPHCRDSVRYLWYNEPISENWPQTEPVSFRMRTIVFGVNASPFILGAVVLHHIQQFEEVYPKAVQCIRQNLYVDDLIAGCSDASAAQELFQQIKHIFEDACMDIRKWRTNDVSLQAMWEPLEALTSSEQLVSGHESLLGGPTMVLGVSWKRETDCLVFDPHPILQAVSSMGGCSTKRSFLSIASRLFDPIGLIAPILVSAKVLMQGIWKCQATWDEPLPLDLREDVNKWIFSLEDLKNVQFPRRIVPFDAEQIATKEVHIFGDASAAAYGAVAFLRCVTVEGDVSCHLIVSRSKVAPLRTISLPRLELLAAVVASRIAIMLKSSMPDVVGDAKFIYWSDAQVVLAWLHKPPNAWKQYIGNRVREIQTNTDIEAWRHCPGVDNSADCLSRGVSPKSLPASWFSGPTWLQQSSENWPGRMKTERDEFAMDAESAQIIEAESKKATTAMSTTVAILQQPRAVIDPERYSNWETLLRHTAWLTRFTAFIRDKHSCPKGALTAQELLQAKLHWLRYAQQRSFADDIEALKTGKEVGRTSKLWRLGPQLDTNSRVLIAKGRVTELNQRNLIILPSHSKITDLIVMDAHKRVFHCRVDAVLAHLCNDYWLMKGRQTIKRSLNSCLVCRKFGAKPFDPPEAKLPDFRTTPSRPYRTVGIDFAGPTYLRGGGKAYILLFSCATSRAIHIELCRDLTTTCFIRALRRFVGRRGICAEIYSDNAKTFKRAQRDLGQVIFGDEVKRYLASEGIMWKFLPERSPFWAGFYERCVQIIKNALRRTLGKASLSEDELATVLVEIESMINSRPITYVPSDSPDPIPLTPRTLLQGEEPSMMMPAHDPTASAMSLCRRFRYSQKVARDFWTRWRRHYMHKLHLWNRRPKHKSSINIVPRVGQVVLVDAEKGSRLQWPLGSIVELIEGDDGVCRAAKVYMNREVTRRPVQKLIPLEADIPEADHEEQADQDEPDRDEPPPPTVIERTYKKKGVKPKPKTELRRPKPQKVEALDVLPPREDVTTMTRYGRISRRPHRFQS